MWNRLFDSKERKKKSSQERGGIKENPKRRRRKSCVRFYLWLQCCLHDPLRWVTTTVEQRRRWKGNQGTVEKPNWPWYGLGHSLIHVPLLKFIQLSLSLLSIVYNGRENKKLAHCSALSFVSFFRPRRPHRKIKCSGGCARNRLVKKATPIESLEE